MDTESVSEPTSDSTKKTINGNGAIADDGLPRNGAWYNITSADIFRNRHNPRNGIDCFFSEASFNQIMGPGPSFKEKLLSQIARIKFEQNKQNGVGPIKTNSKTLEQKKSPSKADQLSAVLCTSTGGFQDRDLKDSLVESSGSESQVLKDSMSSGALSQELKNKTALDSPSLVVTRGALARGLKTSMTVDSGSLSKNMNESLTINSASAVKANRKRKISLCDLVSNIDSVSNSQTLDEQKNKSELNSRDSLDDNGALNGSGSGDDVGALKGSGSGDDVGALKCSGSGDDVGALKGSGSGDDVGALKGSGSGDDVRALKGSGSGEDVGALKGLDSADDVGAQPVKRAAMTPLPQAVSTCEALNESQLTPNVANICRNKKPRVIENNKAVLDSTIVSTSADLKPQYKEENISSSEPVIRGDLKDSLPDASVSPTSKSMDSLSVDKNVNKATIITRDSVDCLNSTSSNAAYFEAIPCTSTTGTANSNAGAPTTVTSIASITCTSSSLDTEASISNEFSDISKQTDSKTGSENLQHSELEKHSSVTSLPVKQNVNGTVEVASADSTNPDNRALNENLKGDTTRDSTAVAISANNHYAVSVSENNFCCKEEMPLALDIAEEPERTLQVSLSGKDLTKDENDPHDEQELCLVMPSLSSDDDDDDDEDNNFKHTISSSVDKHPPVKEDLKTIILATPASQDNQQLPAAPVVMSGNNATISISNPPPAVVEDGNSSLSSLPAVVKINEGDYAMDQFQTSSQVCSWENYKPDMKNMEVKMSDHQLSIQPALLNIPYEDSGHLQDTAISVWSDVDIPIFSVKEASPEPVKHTQSKAARQERKKLQQSVVKEELQPVSVKQQAKDDPPKQDAQKGMNFRRSDLTKEEQAMYLKLYNKYMPIFMNKGPPPVLGDVQRREIAAFEVLQRRVQSEQAEFQKYLLQNAQKNAKPYTFLKTIARYYSASKAKAYRLKLSATSKFRNAFDCLIPLCTEGSPAILKFQQALLEVGIPPRVKLPDVQAGHKPVPIEYNIRHIDNSFPRRSVMSVPGFTHHETASYDANVKTLASKYDFQVVMTSSVMKCLLDNHGPEFERAWNIPVHVVNHDIDGEERTIVYLNKPVFENDLRIKDYSSLFHKYALRTFVSQPKRKPVPIAKKFIKQAVPVVHAEKPCENDDPFDVSSSNVDTLETFGEGCSNLLKQGKTPTKDENVNSVEAEHEAEKSEQKLHPRRLRFNRKYTNWDEVADDNNKLEAGKLNDILDRFRSKRKYTNWDKATDDDNKLETEKPGQSSDNTAAILKKVCPKKLGESETVTNSKLPVSDSESDYEPKEKHSKMDRVGENRDDDQIRHPVYSSVIEETTSLSVDTDDSPQSPQAGDTEPFNEIQSPLSPTASPASPSAMDDSCSSRLMIQQIPLSPVREIPSSPVRLSPSTALVSPPIAASLPYRRSPRTRTSTSESLGSPDSGSQKASGVAKMSSNTGGTQSKILTPLDSILGPSFVQSEGKNSRDTPKEDASLYLPPTEVHSSLVYNLWSLGSLNVLIRTRCHGILKDLKKTRKVYFSPKMEYQSTYGLEQVTVSEVARDWTACFIRPNTNLLRARINAFTSEILMFEELETDQILRSSLNFQPEVGFQFLDRVLRTLVNLQPGYYLVSHQPGDDFCGIRSSHNNLNQPNENTIPIQMRKSDRAEQLPWIPLDPTLLLPHHITNSRIPATFWPKDAVNNNNNSSGGHNKGNRNNSAGNNGTDNKKGGGWRKFNDNKRGGRKGKN